MGQVPDLFVSEMPDINSHRCSHLKNRIRIG